MNSTAPQEPAAALDTGYLEYVRRVQQRGNKVSLLTLEQYTQLIRDRWGLDAGGQRAVAELLELT